MPTHVALLRGINVGGRNRVSSWPTCVRLCWAWAPRGGDLHSERQRGLHQRGSDTATIAAALERAIAEHLGVQPKIIILTRAELAQVVADNPFPDEPNPRWVHAIFRNGPLSPDELAAVAADQQRAQDQGSDDEARVVGTTLFLHTPAASAAASWQPS